MIRRLVLSLIVCVAFEGVAQADVSSSAVMKMLSAQGFSSALDSHTKLRRIGEIRAGRHSFDVYYYSHVNPQDLHGLQEIVVVEDQRTYVGSYLVNVDDPLPQIHGRDILFGPSSGKIHFELGGPPAKALINGDVLELEK
jgi:hypothetical protein